MPICWCGNAKLHTFNADYGKCDVCGTLVSSSGLPAELLRVVDDEVDFYGKKYWLSHQNDDLGFPDIHARARSDLTERNLHWLRTLLKYCLPPAAVMELGCAHGSFVAMLSKTGYDATGVEMSPWVVEFGRRTFGVPISTGPIEDLTIPLGSVDAIALMDVLEHLPDPVATMKHCLALLRPGGLLFIQTPQFRDELNYAHLVQTKGAFLDQLKSDEHLFLFTDRAIKLLFQRLGADHVQFEPAIFGHYDMFCVVGRSPLHANTTPQIESTLLATAGGRFTLALLDLRDRELQLLNANAEHETARIAQNEQIDELGRMLKEAEADRLDRGQQVERLTGMLIQTRADQADRGVQIETLTQWLKVAEADRLDRGRQVEQLTKSLKAMPAEQSAQAAQITALDAKLRESDSDRVARGQQIETLTHLLQIAEADRLDRGRQVEQLTEMLKAAQADQAARGTQIATLDAMLKDSDSDRVARGRQIETLNQLLQVAEVDRLDRGHQVEQLTRLLNAARTEQSALSTQMGTLETMLRESETDRGARAEQIESLTHLLQVARADCLDYEGKNAHLTAMLSKAAASHAKDLAEFDTLLSGMRRLFKRRIVRWVVALGAWPELRDLGSRVRPPHE